MVFGGENATNYRPVYMYTVLIRVLFYVQVYVIRFFRQTNKANLIASSYRPQLVKSLKDAYGGVHFFFKFSDIKNLDFHLN